MRFVTMCKMRKQITDFFKNFKFPGIYVILPGAFGSDNQSEKAKPKLEEKPINIPTEPALVLDTSALIDGRIADITASGFLSGTFIVPSYVIDELKHVADSKDLLKRQRGRRGLEVLNTLKKNQYVQFKLIKFTQKDMPVDDRLIDLAHRIHGKVLTTDYNLNRVAKVTGVSVLNINELANAVKTVILPGETFSLHLLKEGKEKKQAVGYLADGTMVVVEEAKDKVGQELEVKVQRLLQTDAGKMVFAKIVA